MSSLCPQVCVVLTVFGLTRLGLQVLLPMLTRLLEVSSPSDPIALEETRMRAATLLSKVCSVLSTAPVGIKRITIG